MGKKLIGLIIIVLLLGLVIWQVSTPRFTSNSLYDRFDYTRPFATLPTHTVTDLKQTAWIPDWGFANGFKTLQDNAEVFESISPVWYYLEKDGIIRASRVGLSQLQEFCKNQNIKLIPSIGNFDAAEFSIVLSDPDKLNRHIQFLKDEVTKYNFDGLDLDYESILLSDQAAFMQLVSELSAFLKPQGKLLTMAVISKWTDDQAYPSLVQTRKVQNWPALNEYIDEFRIMTYDYTSPGKTFAGPIAPLDWQEAVIRYATRFIPRNKIMLGSNLYAYVWEDKAVHNPTYPTYLEQTNEGATPVFTLNMGQISERKTRTGAKNLSDDGSGEFIFTYPSDGKTYKAYAPSVATNAKRFSLSSQYGIKGIAYWRLGNEDYAIFNE